MGTPTPKLLPCLSFLQGKTELYFKRAAKAEQQHSQHRAVGAAGAPGWGTPPPRARAAPGQVPHPSVTPARRAVLLHTHLGKLLRSMLVALCTLSY